jgi:hypothetical protein
VAKWTQEMLGSFGLKAFKMNFGVFTMAPVWVLVCPRPSHLVQ